jgi:hypothetical protein
MSVTRWVITHLNDDGTIRHLAFPQRARYTYETYAEAKAALPAQARELNLKLSFRHIELRPVRCWDRSYDPCTCWFDNLVAPEHPGFEPADVPARYVNDLLGCFGKHELEAAALVIAAAHQIQGDWNPIPTFLFTDTDDKRFRRWAANPFFVPDFRGLEARGFIRISKPGSDYEFVMIGVQSSFFAAIENAVDRHRNARSDWEARQRWVDDGGALQETA